MTKFYRLSNFAALFVAILFSTGNLTAQCDAFDAACGEGTFTEFSIISTNTGTGTEADPLVGPVQARLCFDVTAYGETGLNYLHGVFLRNVPGKTYTRVGTGEQPINMPGTSDSDATDWRWFGSDDGLSQLAYPDNITAVDGDGFIPFPGYYTVRGADDYNPRDNFGDAGNGDGIEGVTFETFELEAFCFLIDLDAPADGLSHAWTPDLGVSGDGSTGGHNTASVSCFVNSYAPTCGGSDGLGSVHYRSAETPSEAANVITGVTCPNAPGANVNCIEIDAGCGDVDIVEYHIISDHSEEGSEIDPLTGPVEVRVCADVQSYGETGLNYLHGIFITNLPGGATVSNTGSCGDGSGIQPIVGGANGGASDGSHWNWIGYDDGLLQADYPDNISLMDGDGFVPYPGFYVTQGLSDYNPRDNFGDAGDGVGTEGVTLETFSTLEPFCFYVTLNGPAGDGAHGWVPNIGVSGDGSTGSHSVASTTCFIADYLPSCGGSDGLGAIFYQVPAPSALAVELNSFTGTNQDKINVIEWTTATEVDVYQHIVEKSIDGLNYEEMSNVAATNRSIATSYRVEDVYPAELTYYRLRSVFLDGTAFLSEVVSLRAKTNSVLNVYPTPTTNVVQIDYLAKMKVSNVVVSVTDFAGRLVQSQMVDFNEGLNNFQINLEKQATGVYFLSIQDGVQVVTQRLIKE